MNLKEYYQKNVKIIDSNGVAWIGFVEDYCFPDENESEIESIIVRDTTGRLIEFESSDFTEIVTLKD